jgi:serine/threonine-protein kinase
MDAATKRAFYLGRYNCVEELGTGPLGDQFRAKIYGVAGFEKQFSVKRLHASLCADEEFVARFVNAATAYAGLDHDRVARVHEVNVQGAQYYVATDLVRGIELGKLIAALGARGEALPTDVVLLVALDLAEALDYAHARRDLLPNGVVHLGLTPSTVMVTYEGDVKMLDVGLMGALVRLGWADDDRLLPTLAYLAPEELRADPVDGRADVFSLGALMVELLSGERAFPGETAREVRRRIEQTPPVPPATDARLQAILTACLQESPDARPTMAALREAMVPLLASRGQKARGELAAAVRRVARPLTRTGPLPVVAALGPSALVLGAGGAPSTGAGEAPRPWAPPKPPPPPPKVPIGPKLAGGPVMNTLSGVGADDQVLLPLEEIVELPGAPTTPEMPAVAGADTERVVRIEAEPAGETKPRLRLVSDYDADTDHDPVTAPTLLLPEAKGLPSEAAAPSTPSAPTVVVENPGPVVEMVADDPSMRIALAAPAEPPATTPPTPTPPPTTQTTAVTASPEIEPAAAAPFVPPPLTMRPSGTSGGVIAVVVFTIALLGAGGLGAYFYLQGRDAASPVQEAVAKPKPAVEQPKPVGEQPKPVEQAKPVVEQPKPALAAAAGEISVSSEPPGAAVWIDGEARGVTPVRAPLAAGTHRVVVAAEGMKLHKETVRTTGAPVSLALTLERAAGPSGSGGLKVRCKSKGELRIFVDDIDTGRQCPNDVRINAAPGEHKVTLYSPVTDKTIETTATVEDSEGSTRLYLKY